MLFLIFVATFRAVESNARCSRKGACMKFRKIVLLLVIRGSCYRRLFRRAHPVARLHNRSRTFALGNSCRRAARNFAIPVRRASSPTVEAHSGRFERSPRKLYRSLRRLPRSGRLRPNQRRPATNIPGFPTCACRNRKISPTASSVHHSQRRPAHRHARLGQAPRRAVRRQLEAGSVHPQSAQPDQRRTRPANRRDKLSSLHRLRLLPEVPRANLRALAQKRPWPTSFAIRANPRTSSSPISPQTKSPGLQRTRSRSSTAASGSSVTSPKLAMIITRTRAMGRHQQSLAPLFRSQRRDWLGAVLSSRQHAAPHRPHLRRLPLRRLRYPHQKKSPSGTSAANAATAPAASTWRTQRAAISLNPAHMDYVQASDTCIQCHSQGRPLTSPIEGKYYDCPSAISRVQTCRIFGSWRNTSSAKPLSRISPTAQPTKIACRE